MCDWMNHVFNLEVFFFFLSGANVSSASDLTGASYKSQVGKVGIMETMGFEKYLVKNV